MSEFEEDGPERIKGYIIKFDMGRNSGVIAAPGNVSYDFSSQDFLENIPKLMKRPRVSFELVDAKAVRILNDDTLPELVDNLRSGYAIFGAAKCPDCDWRIPILPQSDIPMFRRIHHGRCPKCNSSIKLVSSFKGFHHIAVTGVFAIPATARFFLNRSLILFDDETSSVLATASILFYFVQIFLFFFIYYQERFVKMKRIEAFE